MNAAASSATIDPGKSGDIVVTFTKPMVGMKGVLLRVVSNDSTEPEQVLTLRFDVIE